MHLFAKQELPSEVTANESTITSSHQEIEVANDLQENDCGDFSKFIKKCKVAISSLSFMSEIFNITFIKKYLNFHFVDLISMSKFHYHTQTG